MSEADDVSLDAAVNAANGEPNEAPLFVVSDAPMPGPETVPDHTVNLPPKRPFKIGRGKAKDATDALPPKPVRPKPKLPNRKGQFVVPLSNMYATVGIMLMPIDPVCANAVIQSAEACAKALDDLAYQNDAVRRVVYGLVQTSATGAVIAAHLPIIMAIAMHHVPAAQNALGSMGAKMAEQMEENMRAQQAGNNDAS